MSEQIDWSKAPEGATHATARGDDGFNFWRESSGRLVEFWGAAIHRVDPHGFIKNPRECIPRPTTPQWSGEGLPPVGVVCRKCYNSPDEYYNVKILAHDDHCGDVVIYRWIEGPLDGELDQSTMHLNMASGSNAHWSFRPIRTPEQIAADEREAAIKEMTANHAKNSDALAGWAAYVYDTLGYRKP